MTEKTYQLLRPFVLEHTWNETQAKLRAGRDPDVYGENLLKELKRIDEILGPSAHRRTIQLELDVQQREEEAMPEAPSRDSWLSQIRKRLHPPAQTMQIEKEYTRDPASNYHSWVWSRTHFAVQFTTTGLELLGTTVHEGAHADQSDNARFSTDEQKLVLLNRVLYIPPEKDKTAYRNNYIELQARIQEAKLCIELFPYMQKDPFWNIAERKHFLNYCESVIKNLMPKLTQQSIQQYNDWLIKSLRHTKTDCPYLHDVFAGTTPAERNKSAASFLRTDGCRMHLELFNEAIKVFEKLSKIKHQLQQEVSPEHYDRTVQEDHRREVIRVCQEHGIPLLENRQIEPYPQALEMVDNPAISIIDRIEIAQMYYNPALVITSEGLGIVYDKEPCERPYGPKSTHEDKTQAEISEMQQETRHVDVLFTDEPDDFDEPL